MFAAGVYEGRILISSGEGSSGTFNDMWEYYLKLYGKIEKI